MLRRVALALALLVSLEGGAVEAQEGLTVTVRQLFGQAHRLKVTAVFVVWGFAVGTLYAWLHNVLHGRSARG